MNWNNTGNKNNMKKILKKFVVWCMSNDKDYISYDDISRAFWVLVFSPIWIPFYVLFHIIRYSWRIIKNPFIYLDNKIFMAKINLARWLED